MKRNLMKCYLSICSVFGDAISIGKSLVVMCILYSKSDFRAKYDSIWLDQTEPEFILNEFLDVLIDQRALFLYKIMFPDSLSFCQRIRNICIDFLEKLGQI